MESRVGPSFVIAFLLRTCHCGSRKTVPTTGPIFNVPHQFYSDLTSFCRSRDISVIFDEVASGTFRHGWLSAFEWPSMQFMPDAIALSKGLTSGRHPLSCVLLNNVLAQTIREMQARLPAFTHGLSEPAAWWCQKSLEKFESLNQTKQYEQRQEAITNTAIALTHLLTMRARVEWTMTSIRIRTDQAFAVRLRTSFRRESILIYETSANLGDGIYVFFVVCPALDLLAEQQVNNGLAKLLDAVKYLV